MAEGYRGRIAAMLAADAELEVATGGTAALGGDADEFADAFAVERHERIGRQDAFGGIDAEEARGVVAADAESGLRQVVGAEGEELGAGGDLAGLERRARQFDHRADLIFDLALGLGGDRLRHRIDARLDEIKLRLAGDER